MAIRQANELVMENKKISILLAGPPGIGKTTLALSSPNPLLIDADHGLDRLSAAHRTAYIQPTDYAEILDDLVAENLRDFETLVFDTGGQLIKLIGQWAIQQNPKNGQSDGTLALKGYGAVGREFERLIKYCRDELKKHIVVVFHAKEEKEGDNTKLRLLVEGQTKDNVWQPMDLGGFVEIENNKRILGLSNCDKYFAKGTHGVNGKKTIPELKPDTKNDMLTKLFAQVSENIAQEAAGYATERGEYDKAIAGATEIISGIESPETATAAIGQMAAIQHALTSKRETDKMFLAKIKKLGYKLKDGEYVA